MIIGVKIRLFLVGIGHWLLGIAAPDYQDTQRYFRNQLPKTISSVDTVTCQETRLLCRWLPGKHFPNLEIAELHSPL